MQAPDFDGFLLASPLFSTFSATGLLSPALFKGFSDTIGLSDSLHLFKTSFYKGTDVKKLPSEGYFTGTVTVYHFFPEVRSSEYIEIERHKDRVIFKLYSADARDIAFITAMETALSRERELLESKLLSTQISKLKAEESRLKKSLERLKGNLYDNYGKIQKLTDMLKTVQGKIKTLDVQSELGLDAEVLLKLEELRNASVWYEVGVLKI